MGRNQIFKNLYNRLEQELPKFLYYHSPEHTKHVIDRAEFLAKKEKLSQEETELIKIAALYHDAGFLIGKDDHESKSCELASNELPAYGYSKKEIKAICCMINATRIPQKTDNIYEDIVADADLFYLGTNSYDLYSGQLYKELKHYNPNITDKEWLDIQLNFLQEHTFHTTYARENLTPIKNKNIEILLEAQRSL